MNESKNIARGKIVDFTNQKEAQGNKVKSSSILEELTTEDRENMQKISDEVSEHIHRRIEENKNEGIVLRHASINYFNISALHNKTNLNIGSLVRFDEDNRIKYLCVIVYFGDEKLNSERVENILNGLPKHHVWRKSSKPGEPKIDLNGLIVPNFKPDIPIKNKEDIIAEHKDEEQTIK